ncbi:hypothetical protein BH18VER2_BH18VER2_01910 [soil metagenome]
MVGFLLPLPPQAQADTEVSLNLFYDNLSSQGSWIEVADYGYCFQPSVAVSNSDWRPYSDGYWAYTDLGWTWVSYEDFGWATYHYGRWADLDSYGWVWVPGYEWGPAWVSWRTGGDYVGWAPLPPSSERVYEGRAITGQVDVQFSIGPLYYNFVDIRYIGEPVLRGRILPAARNVTIINNTVNVTNITYNNSVVYNYGPDFNRVNQYSTRPVQRLTLQRETTVGANLGQGRKGNFNRVNGNQLMVVAPTIQKSQQKVAPKQVKAKVEKANFQTGWKGINNRQQVEAEMKKGDPKNIPAPDFQPQKGRKREAVAGAQQGAEQQEQNTAEQKQDAAQGANAGDKNADQREQARQQREQARQQREQAQKEQGAQQTDAQNDRQKNRKNRGKKADQETAAPDADQQEAAQQFEQAQQNDTQKAERQQRAAERRAQQANQKDPAESQPDSQPGAERERKAQKAQQADENQPADNDRPENNRPRRSQRAETAPSAPSADDNSGSQQQAEQPSNRPDRPRRQMQERRSQQQQQQAAPQQQRREQQQQGNDNSDERKGKKKKPAAEPTPQP